MTGPGRKQIVSGNDGTISRSDLTRRGSMHMFGCQRFKSSTFYTRQKGVVGEEPHPPDCDINKALLKSGLRQSQVGRVRNNPL